MGVYGSVIWCDESEVGMDGVDGVRWGEMGVKWRCDGGELRDCL